MARIGETPTAMPGLQWVVLVVGLFFSLAAVMWVREQVRQGAANEFTESAVGLADEVKQNIRGYADVIFSVRALLDAAKDVDPEGFHRFAGGLAIDTRYPGITNISFAHRVVGDGLASFEERMSRVGAAMFPGMPPFAMKPPGARPEYIVLSLMEPMRANQRALGLDLLTDPERKAAVEAARDSGTLSTTSAMTLLRDNATQALSVLLRLGVYEGGGVPATVEERRQRLVGIAGVAIRMPQLMERAMSHVTREQARLRLVDITRTPAGATGGRPSVLFDSAAVGGHTPPVAFSDYASTHNLAVGDRTWSIIVTPLVDPLRNSAAWMLPYAVGAVTLMLSLLILWLLRALDTAGRYAKSLKANLRMIERQRSRLSETQRLAHVGAFEWDTREDHQTWSDELYRLVGRTVGDPPRPDQEFFVGRLLHRDDIAIFHAAMARVRDDRGVVEAEVRVVLPDGRTRVLLAAAQLEFAADGARTHIVGTVRDVTEARLESQRERAQLEFIQTMMDAIPIPVFQKDTAGRFQTCNAAWCAFTGHTRESIMGRTIGEIVAGADVSAISAHDNRLFTHREASSIQTAMPDAQGEMRQLRLHKASFVDSEGRIAGLVGVAFDITDDKSNKERLEQTVAELDRRNKLAALLGDFGELLQVCLGSAEAHEVVAKYLPGLLPGTSGALYCIEAGRGIAQRVARWGKPSGIEQTLQTSECVAVRGGQARCVHDSSHELNCRHLVEPPTTYACLPLTSHGELLGLLHVQLDPDARGAASHLDSDWPMVRSAAEQISLALANLSMRENLQEQATRDKLTGLYNRHYMSARLEQEKVRARRSGATIAVILLDIDHFKHFNDTYGHAAGDHVLREFAAQLRQAGRESDVACRFGGEEFVLFMPDASLEIAQRRAEEICLRTRSLRLEYESRPLGMVTVSAGVAVYPTHGTDPDAVLQAADRALYRAKELGRDRVMLAVTVSAATLPIDPSETL